jgi:hypothetical protein
MVYIMIKFVFMGVSSHPSLQKAHKVDRPTERTSESNLDAVSLYGELWHS